MALAFAAVMGFSVYRMQVVRGQLALVNSRHLPLTLVIEELHTVQGNLLNTIAQRVDGGSVSKFLQRQVELALQYRLHNLRRAQRLLAESTPGERSKTDQLLAEGSLLRLRSLARAFRRNMPLLQRLFDNGGTAPALSRIEGEALLKEERMALRHIRSLSADSRSRVTAAAAGVQQAQQLSVWTGSLLMVLSLLVIGAVTLGVRRLLKPLGRLVTSTQGIASGDYRQRVVLSSEDELGQLAREFNKMAEAIEERQRLLIRSERLAAAGRIASHLTHEVRNPLNSIALNTELLEEELDGLKGEARIEAKAICGAVQREVDRLTGITEQYLQFARMPKPQLEREDLNLLLGALIAFMGEELQARLVRVEFNLERELPEVLADENQLRQVFLNLVRNAAEALGERGGGTLTIRSSLAAESVVVSLQDNGPGIAAADLPQIFDPFFSTKKGGTGLGLALTQQIVHEHGGTIEVSSIEGSGTTFRIELPAIRAR